MKQSYSKSLLLLIISLMMTLTASAYDCEVDGIYYNLNKDNHTAWVTYYSSYYDGYGSAYRDAIVIPSSFEYEGITYSVTSIGSWAFYGCSGLTSITIPNSVTTIDDRAFEGCSGLTSITIPNSVTYIYGYAFSGCSGLTSITIPNSVTYIGNDAFSGTKWFNDQPDGVVYAGKVVYKYKGTMPSGTAIVLDKGTKSISSNAFSGCSGLTSITIPNSVTTIGGSAFSGCSGLTSITIPNSVTYIDDRAFEGCSGLTSITIPNSVTSIGDNAFYRCSGLTSITIPNSVTSIGSQAFYDCSGLTSVTIPNSVTSIGIQAFYGCSGLTSITIPNSVTSIGSWAFFCCGLTSITIPNSVTSIGSEAFYGCTNLQSIILGNNVTSMYSDSFKKNSNNQIFDLYASKDHLTLLTFWRAYSFDDVIYDVETKQPIVPFRATPTSIVKNQSIGDSVKAFTYSLLIDGKETLSQTGLEPDVSHEYSATFKYEDNKGLTNSFTKTGKIYTKTLTFTPLQPRVASPGNVIVAAESNIDDEEKYVGFEWRRTDWADDFKSNEGTAYLYEGMMEGYIRNLNTEKLWRVRPYYESASGKRYYGEWVGLDPTNTSYFEPTVHTYATVGVSGNEAEVKGYVMRGTDNVSQQGFKYWPQAAGARGVAGVNVPGVAQTVTATGNVMTATLKGLQYNTEYCIVAFATTTEGETFYGELQQFLTGIDTAGIESAGATATAATETARYDLRGHRLTAPQRGLNIIRMSDGTVRKVWVR